MPGPRRRFALYHGRRSAARLAVSPGGYARSRGQGRERTVMKHVRSIAGLLAGLFAFGAAGCSSPAINAESRNASRPAPVQPQPAPRQGLTTKQKVLLLAGAAAVYYLYKK